MKEMQMTAMVLTLVMATILMVMLPRDVKADHVRNRSRWLMTCGLLLLSLQFLLQYTLELRQQGVAQAVALNLLFFTPSAMLMALSVLNLQRQGRLLRSDWAVGIAACAVVVVLLAWGVLMTAPALIHPAQALRSPRPLDGWGKLLWAEIGGCLAYIAMQAYYAVCVGNQLKRMRAVLADYYDEERPGLLRWMQWSIVGMQVLALTVPLGIFLTGWVLALYGILFVVAITYQWFSFVRYIITAEAGSMRKAEESEKGIVKSEKIATAIPATESADGTSAGNTSLSTIHFSLNIERWLNAKKFLRHGLTRPEVAREIGISDHQLGIWIKANGFASFSQWMTALRIGEAKRLLREQPDYDIGTIAGQLGFERTHFHRTFKAQTGMSPTEYIRHGMNHDK